VSFAFVIALLPVDEAKIVQWLQKVKRFVPKKISRKLQRLHQGETTQEDDMQTQWPEDQALKQANETAKHRFPTRGDNFATIGKLEAKLGIKPRKAQSFKTHADHQNYLTGRKTISA